MSIIAESTGPKRELCPAGNHIARCFEMIEIGTIKTEYKGKVKELKKVRISWELPHETTVFDETKGPQPFVISKKYTLSLFDKASLRKDLDSWRGVAFTNAEAEAFDVTKLMGVACMLNVIHEKKEDKTYANVATIAPLAKGTVCPPQVNPTFVLSYDEWNQGKFESLPEFIRKEMESTPEFKAMNIPVTTGQAQPPLTPSSYAQATQGETPIGHEDETDIPF